MYLGNQDKIVTFVAILFCKISPRVLLCYTISVTTHQTDIPSSYYRISLKALIRNDKGEVLVNKETGRDHWSLPGGGWDHGESDMDCLKRELYEELGYTGEFTAKPVAVTQEPMWMPNKQAWLLWIVYDVQPDNYDFSAGEESDEVAYMDPDIFETSEMLGEQLIYKFCTQTEAQLV